MPGGIRLDNQREVFIPIFDAATDPTGSPDAGYDLHPLQTGYHPQLTAKTLAAMTVWFDAKFKALYAWCHTLGVIGTASNYYTGLYVDKINIADPTGTRISEDLLFMDTRLGGIGVAPTGSLGWSGPRKVVGAEEQRTLRLGDRLLIKHREAGTKGTATNPKYIPIGIMLEAVHSVNPGHPFHLSQYDYGFPGDII
jgi:hypothetical protein